MLNDSLLKHSACPRYPVPRTKPERDPSSLIPNQRTMAYHSSLLHTIHTQHRFSISHTRLVRMFTIIVVAMSQQRSAALHPRFILIRCRFRPIDLKRSESRRWLSDSNG